MNRSVATISTAGIVLFMSASVALASGDGYGSKKCQPIYGGGDSCPTIPQIEINKSVQNPDTDIYVDNLNVSDPKYAPSEIVTFKITVKNTSDLDLEKIVIRDILPNVVDFANGIGNFDKNSRTLTIELEKLAPNEVRDFFIQAKIVEADKLPKEQGVTCVINQSNVTVEGKTAQDNSQFCIEKNLQPKNPPTTKGGKPVFPPSEAKTTPETGPEALALISLVPSALGGLYLRRKTK